MYCTGAANDEEQQIRQATDERGASAWGGGVPLSGALSAIGGGRQCAPGRGRCACWGRRCVPVGGRCVCLGRRSLGTARVAGYSSTLYRIRAGCKLMRACKTAVQAHRRVQYTCNVSCNWRQEQTPKKKQKKRKAKKTHTRDSTKKRAGSPTARLGNPCAEKQHETKQKRYTKRNTRQSNREHKRDTREMGQTAWELPTSRSQLRRRRRIRHV